MPLYEYKCKKGHLFDKMVPMVDYQKTQDCEVCGAESKKLISVPVVYGTVKYHDKMLADASEASNRRMMSAKDVDAAEKAGEFYRITNPSRHRTYKDKHLRPPRKFKTTPIEVT